MALGSGLTMRAVKTGALPQASVLHQGCTGMTGQAVTAIHGVVLLEIPRLANGVGKVAQRAAAGLDGAQQGGADGGGQALAFFAADLPGGAGGAHASGKQRLVGVNIAHPHHHMVIHQHGFDWRGFATAGGKQHLAVKVIRQGLRPQFHQEWMQFNRAGAVQDGAKATRVAVAQAVLAQQQIHMVVALGRGVGRQMAQAAGHAQVHQQGVLSEAGQQVFGPAIQGLQGLALQTLQVLRHGPAQARLSDLDGLYGTVQQGQQAAAGGFDFR